MIKNCIPLITKELGLELGEKFYVRDENGDFLTYYFNKEKAVFSFASDRLMLLINDSERNTNKPVLENIVLGKYEIVKLPFEPKCGENYWTYDFYSKDFKPYFGCWHNCVKDYLRKASGCVFRTEEQALVARPAKYKELTGKEWKDDRSN